MSSPAAGGCVLTILVSAITAAVFAASHEAGILTVWAVGGVLLIRSARHRMVSDMPATPPPGEERPSCGECAGHELVSVTPLEGQKGMLIYSSAPADRPNHTHIHLARTQETT